MHELWNYPNKMSLPHTYSLGVIEIPLVKWNNKYLIMLKKYLIRDYLE